MPPASVFAVRSALVCFVLAAGIGSAMMLGRAGCAGSWVWSLRTAHIELWTVGGCTLFALGVAWHMFPRRQGSRGSARDERVLSVAVVLLVAGVAARSMAAASGHDVAAILGRAVELAGVAVFAWRLAPRIRPFADGVR